MRLVWMLRVRAGSARGTWSQLMPRMDESLHAIAGLPIVNAADANPPRHDQAPLRIKIAAGWE
jgi:hypothetical protein